MQRCPNRPRRVVRAGAAAVLVFLLGGAPASAGASGGPEPSRVLSGRAGYTALADAAARLYGVDPHLVRALIEVESRWRPDAVSPAGAVGLMQIMPSTAADYDSAADLKNPVSNLRIGVAHLKKLVARYGPVRALGAWNAGEGALARGRVFSSYGETRRFVSRVIREIEALRGGPAAAGGYPRSYSGGVFPP